MLFRSGQKNDGAGGNSLGASKKERERENGKEHGDAPAYQEHTRGVGEAVWQIKPNKAQSHFPKRANHRGYPGVETSADITEPLKKRARLRWMVREPNARSDDLWVLKVDGSATRAGGGVGVYVRSPQGTEMEFAEIGRASCRERVYVLV